ncbi:MAG: LysR family transcriptional regulator [Rhizobiaceae bacterium MnEN-MB40S]|nr:MAG: LysR family transcriptional regulator [Rhizobiaceae bacterium MnEN-MB40S]
MNRRQLEYFVAAAEELNLHHAAERLQISQPSLSRNIQALEETLGASLFIRRPTGLRISDAGETFLEKARNILQAMDDAGVEAKLVDQGLVGRLRVGYIGSATFGLLPSVLEEYWQTYPKVALSLEIMTNSQLAQALISRRIDIALSRFSLADDQLVSEKIIEEPFCLAVPKSVDPKNYSGIACLLEEYRLVIYPERPRPSFADMVLECCVAAGATPSRGVVEAMDVFTALALVREGLAVTIVPESANRQYREGVSLLPLETPMTNMVICANYRRDAQQILIYNFLRTARTIGRAVKL